MKIFACNLEKECSIVTSDLPLNSAVLDQLPVQIGEVVTLICDKSYFIDGVVDQKQQQAQCIENNRWQLLEYKPCIGEEVNNSTV